MNLETQISAKLWNAVRSAYETGNYSGSILDAIYYLSDLIRAKSGIDSDGVGLVGQAFGGAAPIIKVNPLRTESEKDEQRGVEQLLRGLYTAIRNPRSHEKRVDDSATADSIIVFINFLVSLIDKSKSPFDLDQHVDKVFDRHFPEDTHYAELLADRVPPGKRMDFLMTLFERRTQAKGRSVLFVTRAVLKTLSEGEQERFWHAVSEELETITGDSEFRTIIQIADSNWICLSELSRMRAENRLIEAVREGEFDSTKNTCLRGGLGTWASSIFQYFIFKKNLIYALRSKLLSGSAEERVYVYKYFLSELVTQTAKPPLGVAAELVRLLESGDEETHDALEIVMMNPLGEEDSEWQKPLREAFERFQPPIVEITDEDIPF
jgi:uncharacterized protein (TIGR02391 family)